ncbi:MAG: hypothetical protein CMM29_00050 [Rhodospirillaceae bacterium]|nr:hypothetical protein [Rhodospirillaceae bacterium]
MVGRRGKVELGGVQPVQRPEHLTCGGIDEVQPGFARLAAGGTEEILLLFMLPDGRSAPAGDDFWQFPFLLSGGGIDSDQVGLAGNHEGVFRIDQ